MANISEIFYSIQGEGIWQGVPMIFVRFQFCPWDCLWCDSRYTWKRSEGEILSLEGIIERVKSFPCDWVTITGGEPLAQPLEFSSLVKLLSDGRYLIQVFTSGLNPLPGSEIFELVTSWVFDVKCPSANLTLGRPMLEGLSILRPEDQVKFVVSGKEDLDFVDQVLLEHPTLAIVLISPRGSFFASESEVYGSSEDWIREVAEFCKEKGFTLNLQLHKYVWGDKRGR